MKKIELVMLARKVNQIDLAGMVGIRQCKLSKIFRHPVQFQFTPEEKGRIATALAVDEDWLFNDEDVALPVEAVR